MSGESKGSPRAVMSWLFGCTTLAAIWRLKLRVAAHGILGVHARLSGFRRSPLVALRHTLGDRRRAGSLVQRNALARYRADARRARPRVGRRAEPAEHLLRRL